MNLLGSTHRRRLVRLMLLISTFVVLILLVVWWLPKWDYIYLNQPWAGVRWYRGFGLCDQPNILGKLYYRIDHVLTFPEDGICHIEFSYNREKHPFIAWYPDGKLRAKGICKVIIDSNTNQPEFMDTTAIPDAEYYSPDGKIKTTVRNGTGVETYWSWDGVKVWELHLENGKRTQLRTWRRNGTLHMFAPCFKDNHHHGPVYFYDENGKVRLIIYYENGFEVKREKPITTDVPREGAAPVIPQTDGPSG